MFIKLIAFCSQQTIKLIFVILTKLKGPLYGRQNNKSLVFPRLGKLILACWSLSWISKYRQCKQEDLFHFCFDYSIQFSWTDCKTMFWEKYVLILSHLVQKTRNAILLSKFWLYLTHNTNVVKRMFAGIKR